MQDTTALLRTPIGSGHALGDATLLVVFATYNGAEWIGRVLDGYAAQHSAPLWALVVIDNASTDATPAILDQYRERLPLVILREDRPGKNRALNTALEALRQVPCDYVFTDDDAVPDPDFVAHWAHTLAARRGYALFGGTVAPSFEGVDRRNPRRYGPYHAEIYAQNSRPEGEISPRHIFGPNMAVSGELIRAGHRFDENIGPSSADSCYPMGSETEFCIRVARLTGVAAWFACHPKVHHIVRANQTTETFILQRAFRHGRGFAQMEAPAAPGRWASIKTSLRLGLLRLAGRIGSTRAKWNAGWLEGYRAGLGRDETRKA